MGRTIFAIGGVGKSLIRSHIRRTSTTSPQSNENSSIQTPITSDSPIWLQDKLPSNYWEDEHNQKKFIEWAAKQLNIQEMSDWYKITRKDLYRIGGTSLLATKYGGSPCNLLMSLYPKYNWLPWKFTKSPKGYWDIPENQLKFLEFAANQLNVKQMSDWYKVTQADFEKVGGSTLIKHFGTFSAVLNQVYPDYEWLPWKFWKTPKGYWEDQKNQRNFLEWAKVKLNVKDMSDWYKITFKDFEDIGAASILQVNHSDSVYSMLSSVYPEYEWLPWRFAKTPKGYWDSDKNKKKFFEWAGKQLGITQISDWKNISTKDIAELGGGALLGKHSLPQLLSIVSPDYVWQESKPKTSHTKKSQYLLKSMLKSIFPQEEVLEEYRHPDLYSPVSQFLELDFYYPKFKLAIEYQGEQHYNKVQQFFSNMSSNEERQKSDVTKSNLCKNIGITLIDIPYWWDRKFDSLAATLYSYRPDLFKEQPVGTPIPLAPTESHKSNKENSSKKLFMTAMEWENSMDPTGWWMTEKFDGMRLYWNGSQFLTRSGGKVEFPPNMMSVMPNNVILDGELWSQYGLYQEVVSICRKSKLDDERWQKVVYFVFDAPTLDKPYEERVQHLKDLKEKGDLPSFVKIIEAVQCKGTQHLKEYFDEIIAKGGEGVVLREPQSVYKAGRSTSIRKYKEFADTEVKVIENNYPHGFNCQQINGKTIYVGLSDNYEQAKKIKEGAVITVKHQGMNVYGTLQYPKFYRERTDVKWEDLKINT